MIRNDLIMSSKTVKELLQQGEQINIYIFIKQGEAGITGRAEVQTKVKNAQYYLIIGDVKNYKSKTTDITVKLLEYLYTILGIEQAIHSWSVLATKLFELGYRISYTQQFQDTALVQIKERG